MQTVTCIHCGYILAGLPAKRCADCGHLYLQCPECGKTQEANAAGIALVRSIQRIIGWVPRIVQGIDITLLVIVGTLAALCGLGAAGSPTAAAALIPLGCIYFMMAVLVDAVVLRFRNRWRGHFATVGILGGAMVLGTPLAMALGIRGGISIQLAQSWGWLLTGAMVGALFGRILVGTLLVLLFKNSDRQWIVARYQAAMREGRWRKAGSMADGQVSLFCIHCRGAVPPATPQSCPACQLTAVDCPTCGKSTPVSASIPAVEAAAEVGRAAWLLALGAVRLFLAIWTLHAVWAYLFTSVYQLGSGFNLRRWGLPPWDMEVIMAVPALTALASLVVFAGRKPFAALLGVWSIALYAAGMYYATNVHWLSYEYREAGQTLLIATGQILLLQLLAVILAGVFCAAVKAILPKRQMVEIDDLTPFPHASAPTPVQ